MTEKRQIRQSNPEDWSFEQLKAEYISAQKTIEELREIRKFSYTFMQILCNYDIKTPLNLMLGFADIILQGVEGPVNEQIRKDLTIIYNKGQDIFRILDTVLYTLTAERILAGIEEPFPSNETDLAQVIQDSKLSEKENVKISGLDRRLPTILVDPLKLELAVVETTSVLSENFTKGETILDVTEDDNFIILRISNSEIVLPDEVLEKYKEVANASSLFAWEYVSSQLILSVARFYVEMYGGSMKLENKKDMGTEVLITLPVL